MYLHLPIYIYFIYYICLNFSLVSQFIIDRFSKRYIMLTKQINNASILMKIYLEQKMELT